MNNVIPIHALFDESGIAPNLSNDPRPALHDAEVIYGVDVMSQAEFLVYGREVLEEGVASGVPRSAAVLRVGIDYETDELERLVALVRVVKGHDDYPR